MGFLVYLRMEFWGHQDDIGVVVMELRPFFCKRPVCKHRMPTGVGEPGDLHSIRVNVILLDKRIDHIAKLDVGVMHVNLLGVPGNVFNAIFDLVATRPQKPVHLIGIIGFIGRLPTGEEFVVVDLDN